MSEASEQVWKSMKGELQRVRRRRMMVKAGVMAGIGVVATLGVMKSLKPVEKAGEGMVSIPQEVEVPRIEMEPDRLAVLVYDGEGMRFELLGADQLASCEMEFSLQPVVRNTGAGDLW